MKLEVKIGRLTLKNPVTVASGTFGYAFEFEDLVNLNSLGAIVTKTITRMPKPGNAQPRLAETPAGMLNAIGLQNEGLDNFIRVKLPKLRKIKTRIIVSISGVSTEDYVYCAKMLEAAGVEALELNLSCPNVQYNLAGNKKSMMFAQDAQATYELVHEVCRSTKCLVISKLSPNVTDIVEIAKAAEEAGSDALSLVNTLLGMAIDIETFSPKLANITGGLSGPAIKPVALRMVYEVCKAVEIPVIGMGGIASAEDALEFMIAGASAVSIGTASFVNPSAAIEVIEGLKKFGREKGFKNINEIIGRVRK